LPVVLFLSVFLIAACGLIYELIAGTLASYLLGDSVLQFSTVIGSYLFAMGIGSWLSKYLGRGLVARFIYIELMVGLIGGFSSSILFLAFAWTDSFRLLLYLLVLLIGMLVGLEIPLLMRILKDRFQFHDLVAHVLTFDYLGALGASLLFPLLLVPRLGLVRSALLFGIINAGVALWSTFLFRDSIGRAAGLRVLSVIVLAALSAGMFGADRIAATADDNLYADEVIFARNTRYQRIVLTKWKDDLRLFLSSHLQFSSRDEYRYHEGLVHPGLAALPGARSVLVLGGGDGLAVREILKYPSVEQVTLVDLDPEMTKIFSTNPALVDLNKGSLKSSKVRVVNEDAFPWLDHNDDMFDFVVVDFPDPTNYSLGKLYTTAFYRLLARHVSANGFIAVQSTSPLFARQSYWCIVNTLKQAGLKTWPYHVYVPSFGEWGFVLAGAGTYEPPTGLPAGLRFLAMQNLPELFRFPIDMLPVYAEPNRLNDQVLVRYYEHEWKDIAH
jgi:spermidine synthase